ncbi:hypothetical protein V1264_004891 [Littorina saxatilis]|uniref:ABC transmembrane type-1 domain-containing protein n=1 Tax=Littorina saxatilis TaxID=31220 RepID=A0AAN9G7D3_9CAEN
MRRQILADVESATTDAATSGDDMQIRIRGFLPRRKKRKDRDRRHQAERHKGKGRQSAYDEVDPVMEDRGKLILSETLVKGRMPFHVYLHYPRAAGLVSLLVAALCFASFRAASVGANFWLRQWTGDPVLTNQSTWGSEVFVNTNEYYLTVYGIFGVLQVVLLLAYNALYWVRTIQASSRLHDRMIRKLFRAPMAFFDTTPIGRIMNRVSTDMEIVDNLMPIIFRDLVSTFTVLLASVVVLVVVSPTSIVVLLPLAVFCYFSLASYVPMSRQCRRMEAVTRSPIFAHFSETITGAATIRAYRATQRFVQESKIRVDDNQKFYFAWMAGLRWIQMSLDGVTNVVIFMAAILEIVSPNPSGGAAGLSVSYALQVGIAGDIRSSKNQQSHFTLESCAHFRRRNFVLLVVQGFCGRCH